MRIALLALAGTGLLALSACNDQPFDPQTQVGPNPQLPEPHQYLFPPMHLAPVVGWKDGDKPESGGGI